MDNPDVLEVVLLLHLVISYDNKNRAFESLKLEQENKKQQLEAEQIVIE